MTNRRVILAVAIVLLAGLAGCVSEDGDGGSGSPEDSGAVPAGQVVADGDVSEGVSVHVDEQREVVCYVYRDDANGASVGGTGGISCLPFSEVKGYGG